MAHREFSLVAVVGPRESMGKALTSSKAYSDHMVGDISAQSSRHALRSPDCLLVLSAPHAELLVPGPPVDTQEAWVSLFHVEMAKFLQGRDISISSL